MQRDFARFSWEGTVSIDMYEWDVGGAVHSFTIEAVADGRQLYSTGIQDGQAREDRVSWDSSRDAIVFEIGGGTRQGADAIRVFDVAGRCVLSAAVDSEPTGTVSTVGMSGGVYFVEFGGFPPPLGSES